MIQRLTPAPEQNGSLAAQLLRHDPARIGRTLTLRVTGRSMFPALRRGDVVELAPPGQLVGGELVLFHHRGALVCHRVIAVLPDGSVRTQGDNGQRDGELVGGTDVLGRVARVRRRGRSMDPRCLARGARSSLVVTAVRGWRDSVHERVVRALTETLVGLTRLGPVQSLVGRIATRMVSFAIGIPAPLASVRAYAVVALRPCPDREALIRDLANAREQEAILFARLGARSLGSLNLRTGETRIGRIGSLLGIDADLHEIGQALKSGKVRRLEGWKVPFTF